MTSRSNRDYDTFGFRSREIFAFLQTKGIDVGATFATPQPTAPPWLALYRAMPRFTIAEAACLLAGEDPHAPDYGSFQGQDPETDAAVRRFQRILTAAVDAGQLIGGHWGSERLHQEIEHQELRAWCRRNGLTWPVPAPVEQQVPVAQPEIIAEIERLRAENTRLVAELAEARSGENHADHPAWPPELDLAMIAWRTAVNGAAAAGMTPRNFMKQWLEKNHPDLSADQIDRISTVANWMKAAGRPSRKAK